MRSSTGARSSVNTFGPGATSRMSPFAIASVFCTYIGVNRAFIPNYGERYRYEGDDLDGVRGVNGESGDEQMDDEEVTNAADATGGTLAPTGADTDAERRPAEDVLSVVSSDGIRGSRCSAGRIAPVLS